MSKKAICFLTPGSARTEYLPIELSPYRRARNRMRRIYDRVVYAFGGWAFANTTYELREVTNRGDSAIRLATRELLGEIFDDSYELHEFAWAELSGTNMDWIRRNAHLFVVAGGGYFFFDKQHRLPERIVRDVAFLKTLDCPVVCLSTGVNHLITTDGDVVPRVAAETLTTLQTFLDCVSLCSSRSVMGARVLGLAATRAGTVRVLPDPALLMTPQPPNPAISTAPKGVVTIGLNLAFHGPFSSTLLPRLIPVVIEALRRFAEKRPSRLVYFVHADGERLLPSLLRKAGLTIEIVDQPPAQMIGAFQSVDIHLCQMLHSSIFAANAGVPVLNVAYDMKNIGFFELMTLEPWCVPHGDLSADRLADALETLYQERDAIRDVLKRRKAELAADMARFLSEVAELVRRGGQLGADGRAIETMKEGVALRVNNV